MSKKAKKKQKGDENEFADFVSQAIRAPRAGAYEHLLSQFLASAVVVTDPLKRVKIVSEASLMVPEGERGDLAIEYDRVQELNAVANALLNRSIRKLEGAGVVSVPWGFPRTEENFEKFIAPWFECKLCFWPQLIVYHVETWKIWKCLHCRKVLAEKKLPFYGKPDVPSKCPRCGEKLSSHWSYLTHKEERIVNNPLWSFFFDASGCLTLDGYNTLKNSFAAWAIPIVQAYLAELTHVVSPGLYSQIIGLYTRRGKKSYAEKVKDAEMPSDEDSLGPR